ncbi:MAG: PAS domain-containing protein [Candidatus Methylacidiphilales bacterium]|nr:PAS domain-containing protein [Candidatus Methylacidiphilales bacterium]
MTIASQEDPDSASELAALRLELKQCRVDLEIIRNSEQNTRRIAESKLAEEQLRRSEADLHHAQRLTNTCSWKHDLSTGKVIATPETYRIFDIQPDEDASDPALYFGRIHPEDRPRVLELFQRCEIEKADYEADFRIVLPDGTVRHQRSVGHPVLNEAGELVEFVGTAIDTTEQERTRENLERALAKAQKTEAYLVEAQRLSQTGSFSWHVATGDLFWSDEMFAIYEFDRAVDLTVERVHQRVHPDDLPMILEVVGQAVREERGWELEHRLLMPDGSVKHLRAVTHAEKHASGDLEIFGALMDVTASKQAQERLRLAHMELAHVTRLTTIGELTASIAHEVNQPLGAVVTNADACLRWLNRESPNLNEIREAISSIIRDGHRGSEVIARVRALLKKAPPEKQRLDINTVIREIVAMVEPNLCGATLEFALTDGLPLVLGDRVLIQQVLLNLILNAVEAMKLVTGRPRLLGICTKARDEGGVWVRVTDAGEGIKREHLDRVFTAFYTTKSDGLGLGLSLSRSIIEDHGGRLWVTSNETHGVTFQFTLPEKLKGELAP